MMSQFRKQPTIILLVCLFAFGVARCAGATAEASAGKGGAASAKKAEKKKESPKKTATGDKSKKQKENAKKKDKSANKKTSDSASAKKSDSNTAVDKKSEAQERPSQPRRSPPAAKKTDAAGPTRTQVRSGVFVYPRAGSSLTNPRTTIGADFRNLPAGERSDGARLLVDGVDVTIRGDAGAGYIFFTPDEDLKSGRHEATLRLRRLGKTDATAAQWSFNIAGTQQALRLYPSADATVETPRPMIGLSLGGISDDLQRSTIRIILDGTDVTSRCDITGDYAFYEPAGDLAPGRHAVKATMNSTTGTRRDYQSWSFTVIRKDATATTETRPTAEKPKVCEPDKEGKGVCAEKPSAEARPGPAPKAPKNKAASAIAKTQRRGNAIASGAEYVERLGRGAAPAAEERTAERAPVEKPVSQPAAVETPVAAAPAEPVPVAAAQPAGGGFEYAMENTVGFEDMKVGGDKSRSSQRPRGAFLYRMGLRTEQALTASRFKSPSMKVNMKMEGTSDGDETETMFMLKKLTASVVDENHQLNAYDIQPKYSPYTLTGQRLVGGEVGVTGPKTGVHLFQGRFKTQRAGKQLNTYGLRYTNKMSRFDFGFQSVYTRLRTIRDGSEAGNSVSSLTLDRKYSLGEVHFEYAYSNASGLDDDKAYRFESTMRKKKAYMTLRYENVGSFFRTESGFASYGLVELNSSMQYAFSKKIAAVLGFQRRTFRAGGSHTLSMPAVLKITPFPDKPSTSLELRHKAVNFNSGSTWKDTYTDNLDFRHKFGNLQTQFGYKQETKQKSNVTVDEKETLSNWSVSRPITKKTTLSYKASHQNNNYYGLENRKYYGVAYDLSEWSDIRFSYDTSRKTQNILSNRKTQKLNFGKVNPEDNTEMSMEFYVNRYPLYNETYFKLNYSKFY